MFHHIVLNLVSTHFVALDGDQPDVGDAVGGSIALVGVLLIMMWPRR